MEGQKRNGQSLVKFPRDHSMKSDICTLSDLYTYLQYIQQQAHDTVLVRK